MSISLKDLDKCCRCCLTTRGTLKPLFGTSLDEMLQQIVPLIVYVGDGYPEHICTCCVTRLSMSYTFYQNVMRSYHTLTNVLEASRGAGSELKAVEVELEVLDHCVEEKQRDCDVQDTLSSTDTLHNDAALEIHKSELNSPVNTDEVLLMPRDSILPDAASDETSTASDDGDVTSSPKPTAHLKCPHCTTYFEKKVDLKIHVLTHRERCAVCGKLVPPPMVRRHAHTHAHAHTRRKLYACHVCGRRFADQRNLCRHKRAHTGGLHLCSYCGKEFKWKTSLYRHVRHHTGSLVDCSVCGKQFADPSSLNIHLVSHESNTSPFTCAQCGNTFTQKASLNKHVQRAHATHRTRYACGDCGKSFYNRLSLRFHQINKHSTGETTLQCNECDKKFHCDKSLKDHFRYHRRKAFRIAKREAKTNADVIIAKAESVTVEFLCLVCRAYFKSRSALEAHNCANGEEGITTTSVANLVVLPLH